MQLFAEKLKGERASYLEYQKLQRQIETLTRLVIAFKYTRAVDLDTNAEGEVANIQNGLLKKKRYFYPIVMSLCSPAFSFRNEYARRSYGAKEGRLE